MSKANDTNLDMAPNHRAISAALVNFEGHSWAQNPSFRAVSGTMSFSGAIPGRMSFLPDYIRQNVLSKTRFLRTFVAKLKTSAQSQASILPAIVGRTARLPAYSAGTLRVRVRRIAAR